MRRFEWLDNEALIFSLKVEHSFLMYVLDSRIFNSEDQFTFLLSHMFLSHFDVSCW
jgi:hypothetical protein